MQTVTRPRFIGLDRLQEMLTRWNNRRDEILEAYRKMGVKGIQRVTNMSTFGARHIAMRLGLIKPGSRFKSPEELIRKRERRKISAT